MCSRTGLPAPERAGHRRALACLHRGPGRLIYAIYLVPAAWDQGIGRQLMTAPLGRLGEAGYDQATLWVLDSNARARRFYEAGGWHADGAAKQDESFGQFRRPDDGGEIPDLRAWR